MESGKEEIYNQFCEFIDSNKDLFSSKNPEWLYALYLDYKNSIDLEDKSNGE